MKSPKARGGTGGSSPPEPAGPLDGVRVLDLGGELSAYGTKILADLGADVVKAEPAGGDRQRRRPPFAPGPEPRLETSLTFAYYNANKRGVQLDWAGPGGAPGPGPDLAPAPAPVPTPALTLRPP